MSSDPESLDSDDCRVSSPINIPNFKKNSSPNRKYPIKNIKKNKLNDSIY